MPTAQYCPFVCRDACKLCVCVRWSVPWQCLGNWAQEDWLLLSQLGDENLLPSLYCKAQIDVV
jgi:hypothetical protein